MSANCTIIRNNEVIESNKVFVKDMVALVLNGRAESSFNETIDDIILKKWETTLSLIFKEITRLYIKIDTPYFILTLSELVFHKTLLYGLRIFVFL